MLTGCLRYGRLGDKNKPQWDRCLDIQRRLNNYVETGNLEMLVDCANLCMCEFVEGNHPRKHFKSLDDGEHTKEK